MPQPNIIRVEFFTFRESCKTLLSRRRVSLIGLQRMKSLKVIWILRVPCGVMICHNEKTSQQKLQSLDDFCWTKNRNMAIVSYTSRVLQEFLATLESHLKWLVYYKPLNCSAKFSDNPESMSKSKPLTKRAWHSGIASNVVCQIGGSLRCAGHCLTHNFRDQPEGGRPQRKAERWFHVLFKWFQFRLQLTANPWVLRKLPPFHS